MYTYRPLGETGSNYWLQSDIPFLILPLDIRVYRPGNPLHLLQHNGRDYIRGKVSPFSRLMYLRNLSFVTLVLVYVTLYVFPGNMVLLTPRIKRIIGIAIAVVMKCALFKGHLKQIAALFY